MFTRGACSLGTDSPLYTLFTHATHDDDDDYLHTSTCTTPQEGSARFRPLRARLAVNQPRHQHGIHRASTADIQPERGNRGTVQQHAQTTRKAGTTCRQTHGTCSKDGRHSAHTHKERHTRQGTGARQCVPARMPHAAPRHMHTRPTAATHTTNAASITHAAVATTTCTVGQQGYMAVHF
jgi:hypothetical protein